MIKKFSLSGKAKGIPFSIVITLDECDAYIMRTHLWAVAKTSSGGYYISRWMNTTSIPLSHQIISAETHQTVRHKNGDILDFRRENLYVYTNQDELLKTHCIHGHALTKDNIQNYSGNRCGYRCRTCARISSAKSIYKKLMEN